MRRRGFTALTAGLVLAAAWTSRAQAEPPKVGDALPAFELVGSDGKTYKSGDFKGKQALVIAWYPKAFTGG